MEVYSIILTQILTILIGLLIFVLSQFLLITVIEPLKEQRKIISKIKSDLVFYANRFTSYSSRSKEDIAETVRTLRKDAADLMAITSSIFLYSQLQKLKLVPQYNNLYTAHENLISLSNSVNSENIDAILEKKKIIEKAFSEN